MSDPVDGLAQILGDAADRVAEHAAIWHAAAHRNAAGEYKADDLIADLQKAWEMQVEDSAKATAALLDLLGTRRDGERAGDGDAG